MSLSLQEWRERRHQRARNNLRAFGGGMDAVGLNGVGDMDEVFVDHGNECHVMLGGKIAKDLVERLDIVGAVIRWQGDSGEEHLDVRRFECRENGIEVAARLIGGKAAEAVVPAEFDNHDGGMGLENGLEVGCGVLGGGAAGAHIRYLVMEATLFEIALKRIRVGLAGLKTIAGRDAVAVADDDRALGCAQRQCENQD